MADAVLHDLFARRAFGARFQRNGITILAGGGYDDDFHEVHLLAVHIFGERDDELHIVLGKACVIIACEGFVLADPAGAEGLVDAVGKVGIFEVR